MIDDNDFCFAKAVVMDEKIADQGINGPWGVTPIGTWYKGTCPDYGLVCDIWPSLWVCLVKIC